MAKLSNVTVDDLRDALTDVSTGKAAKRLMITLAYKDGVGVETLSACYAIPRSTLYYWLNRFKEMPIHGAIEDEDRPGQPLALSDEERRELRTDLRYPLKRFTSRRQRGLPRSSTTILKKSAEYRIRTAIFDGCSARLKPISSDGDDCHDVLHGSARKYNYLC